MTEPRDTTMRETLTIAAPCCGGEVEVAVEADGSAFESRRDGSHTVPTPEYDLPTYCGCGRWVDGNERDAWDRRVEAAWERRLQELADYREGRE